MMSANGYEINAYRGIIMSFEMNGTTVMFVGIVGHGAWRPTLISISFSG
jgi:hypothetical protein